MWTKARFIKPGDVISSGGSLEVTNTQRVGKLLYVDGVRVQDGEKVYGRPLAWTGEVWVENSSR